MGIYKLTVKMLDPTCARSVAVGHMALQRTFLMTSGSKLTVISRMMLSQAGPLDSICMNT